MRIETLKGSHYEIGLQIGKKMREHGWDLPNYVKERNVQFAVETERKVRSMISGLLETTTFRTLNFFFTTHG